MWLLAYILTIQHSWHSITHVCHKNFADKRSGDAKRFQKYCGQAVGISIFVDTSHTRRSSQVSSSTIVSTSYVRFHPTISVEV